MMLKQPRRCHRFHGLESTPGCLLGIQALCKVRTLRTGHRSHRKYLNATEVGALALRLGCVTWGHIQCYAVRI